MGEATPKGVYPTLWDWVEQSRAGLFRDHEMQNVMYMEEAVRLTKPKGIKPPDHPAFENEAVTIPKAYVAVLPQGRYWVAENKMAAVIAPDNKIVMDVSMQYRRQDDAIHPVYKRSELPPANSTGDTVALINFIWDNNYYHWLGDVLGRLHLLERSGIRVDKYMVTGKGSPKYKSETLAMLGVPEKKIVKSKPGMHLKPRRLVVPSLATYRLQPFVPHSMPKWASHYLRNAFLSQIGHVPADSPKCIYISRKYAAVRKMTNEDDVSKLLGDIGFQEVVLESLPLAEQIKLFAGAELIVAPHGAGLANLMFCRPGTKVLELFAPNYVHPVYWYLSNHIGLDYYYLFGEGERLPIMAGIGNCDCRTDNITVNMEQLFETVYEMKTGGLE
ncbi:glycosyltransferase family 61 protein [Paenibacillus ginsengarvi]|uniref:Glycosyltransferase family 61 protein n=1 Tax=Paenibacillus ginsengarvi TaxID=400777 RepID=A0A3B0CI40_9BACL|nr:glycosyltransferase family 61 protein [Paenibacillus ginsengarvi]RKN85335.1 glycosyltransferase family 61 protein [Paenibacillus ginsengarvi]